MKQKRIIAVVTAATLMLSGSFAAWATEAEDIEYLTNMESEAEVIAEEAETAAEEVEAAEATGEALSQAASEGDLEAAGIDALETLEAEADSAEIDDIAEILEEDESAENLEDEEEEEDEDAEDEYDPLSTDTSGHTEIAEENPALIGYIIETDGGIQPLAKTEYTPYTNYTYDYQTFTKTVDGHSGDEILDKAVSIIVSNEGGYNTVLANDNNSGALSVGKIGWHANYALTLVRLIVVEDNAKAWELLGEKLYNEIIDSNTSWKYRVLTESEVKKFKNFLDPDQNPASKTIQDKLARSYIATYATNGYGLGIRNAAALVDYADIENQYGYEGYSSMGGAKACANYAKAIAGSWDKVTLNELHLASVANIAHTYTFYSTSVQGSYIERRRSTYGKLATCGWTYCNSGDYTIPYDTYGTTGAAWLQVALNSYTNAGLSVTGAYDDALKAAVTAYQKTIGYTADGWAGLKTSTKLIHDMYYDMMTSGASMGSIDVSSGTSSTGADIVKINGVWTYTYNGTADYTYTGLAKNSNGWYYIKNGELDRTYTGFATNENGSWYITEGKLTRKDNTVIKDTKGVLGSTDEWYYVVGSKVRYDFTGLANYSNSSGWWYITNGVVDRTYNGLAKNKNGWYYLTNGKVNRSYTGFATNENGSWYMTNGKLTRKDSTVIKDTKGVLGAADEWYYVVDSKVRYDFTGLANYKNSSGWWYITNGVVDRSYAGLAKNKNGWYYLTNGKVDRSYTGFAVNENGSWYVTNGKLTRNDNTVIKDTKGVLGSADEWYYVVGSKVQYDFTGLAHYKNASGWWYITDGKVDRSFTGIAKNQNGWWFVQDGKVQKSFNGYVTAGGVQYTVKNGKVDK